MSNPALQSKQRSRPNTHPQAKIRRSHFVSVMGRLLSTQCTEDEEADNWQRKQKPNYKGQFGFCVSHGEAPAFVSAARSSFSRSSKECAIIIPVRGSNPSNSPGSGARIQKGGSPRTRVKSHGPAVCALGGCACPVVGEGVSIELALATAYYLSIDLARL